jgi:Sulfotransferase domain
LPDFRFDKISDIARGARAILSPGGDATAPGVEQPQDPKNAGQGTSERRKTRSKRREFARAQRAKIKSKKQELSRIRKAVGAATDRAEAIEHKGRKKRVQQEIFELERELRAVRERRAEDHEPVTGALPDFVVIGAMKGGTSFFYHLLTQHPLVEPCAKKELHFFDLLFEQENVEWYRRCFPTPRWKDGQKTITGEATPYMAVRHAPERMARVVPEARLIALLRNPIDRAFSHHQQVARKGRETQTFEEAIETERGRPLGGEDEVFERQDRATGLGASNHGYLFQSIYVDQLLRWSEYFSREQMLVLKSEDFFERPQETLKTVFSFLDLPEWEVEAPEPRDGRDRGRYERNKRNKGRYEEEMDPATRRRLEEYFEAHNRRLYEFLGTDFGW